MEVTQFQNEVRAWAEKNFGPKVGTGYRSLLGAMEELGELAHAHLKEEQRIRPMDYDAAKRDAIGDILIYLAHYCCDQGFDLQAILDETWNEVRKRDWNKNKENGVTNG